MIRILLVDDHSLVRIGLRFVLEAEPDFAVVGEASDSAEALKLFREVNPDVVLLDIRMPHVSGLETLVQLRAIDATAKVVMLTTSNLEEDIYQSVTAGAVGYLLKDSAPTEIVAGVRAATAGKKIFPPDVMERLHVRQHQPDLSPRQREILEWLARGRSNKEIAQALNISVDSVKTHLKALFLKLEAVDRSEAVTLAIQRGIIKLDQ
mgnify:CR=1 FL=1